MRIETHVFHYLATSVRVVDGDTVKFHVDQGLGNYRQETIRLTGVDAPELGKSNYLAAKEFVHQWLYEESSLWWDWVRESNLGRRKNVFPDYSFVLYTDKADSFGRWVAVVHSRATSRVLNDDLLAAGLAVKYVSKSVAEGNSE